MHGVNLARGRNVDLYIILGAAGERKREKGSENARDRAACTAVSGEFYQLFYGSYKPDSSPRGR